LWIACEQDTMKTIKEVAAGRLHTTH
jgi:hypothetical protein